MKKLMVALAVMAIAAAAQAAVIFTETMGTVGGTTTFAAHTTALGWDNDSLLFSGDGDLRATSGSTGYSGASGGANVFLTTPTRSFIISGINTTAYTDYSLTFGAFKTSASATPQAYSLDYSTDGSSWTSLSPANLTGSGNSWQLVQFTSVALPSSATLSIRWQ